MHSDKHLALQLSTSYPNLAEPICSTCVPACRIGAILFDAHIFMSSLNAQAYPSACVVRDFTCAYQVCPTGDGRGNGAFAAKHIPAGAYLGDYEGELLDEAAYWARYPSGVVCSCRKLTGYLIRACITQAPASTSLVVQ